MSEPTEMEGAAINGMWGAEEERDQAEKQRDELLEAIDRHRRADGCSFHPCSPRARLYNLANRIEEERS